MDDIVYGLQLNGRSWSIADSVAERAAELRVIVRASDRGARIIDAGIEARGGLAAGRALAELCMGGLGHISFVPLSIGDESYTGVQAWTDHPAVACMASQYAGWAIKVGEYFAMGSGPLRAHVRAERELFDKLGYEASDSTCAGSRAGSPPRRCHRWRGTTCARSAGPTTACCTAARRASP
jgi:methenyltetrahydromethanopterin cyclohydrolase